MFSELPKSFVDESQAAWLAKKKSESQTDGQPITDMQLNIGPTESACFFSEAQTQTHEAVFARRLNQIPDGVSFF